MRLSAPKKNVFWLSVILAAVAVVGQFVAIPVIGAYTFWIMTAGYVVLAAGNALKGL